MSTLNDAHAHIQSTQPYIQVTANVPLWYRLMPSISGQDSWYLRLIIDSDDTHDTLLTFGPFTDDEVTMLTHLLSHTHCTYEERHVLEQDGDLFESSLAQGDSAYPETAALDQ